MPPTLEAVLQEALHAEAGGYLPLMLLELQLPVVEDALSKDVALTEVRVAETRVTTE